MKAIIITSQRSGSNFLRHCLNTHPMIACDGELLIGGQIIPPRLLEDKRLPTKIYRYFRAGAWRPHKILANFYSRSDAPVVVFKAMYNHLKSAKALEFIRKHKDIRIIHLRRDNLLKQYVSKVLIGKKRSRDWQPHSTTPVPIAITRISPKAAILEMRRVQNNYEKFKQMTRNHQTIELVYETMIDGGSLTHQAASMICNLFDIEIKPMCCNFVKINPDKLELIIENYQEVVNVLYGTAFERFLD